MKRIAVILIIFLAVGVGTYARVLLTQQPSASEPIEKGGIYQIGFCTTSLGVQNEQYIRVVRELARGWVEVDWRPCREHSIRRFAPTIRIGEISL